MDKIKIFNPDTSAEAQSSTYLVGAIMPRFCSECNKPNIHCKGMCQACYSKMCRNTEKGKERMRLYNLTLGKEAQKRYREKNKLNKPPKPPKQNCECGKMSVVKGYCFTCYQRYYQRKKFGYKEGKRKNKVDNSLIFNKVLLEVKKGFSIEKACKKANIDRKKLYYIMSPIQNAELTAYKIIGFVDDDDSDPTLKNTWPKENSTGAYNSAKAQAFRDMTAAGFPYKNRNEIITPYKWKVGFGNQDDRYQLSLKMMFEDIAKKYTLTEIWK
jgi:hypothetical protein